MVHFRVLIEAFVPAVPASLFPGNQSSSGLAWNPASQKTFRTPQMSPVCQRSLCFRMQIPFFFSSTHYQGAPISACKNRWWRNEEGQARMSPVCFRRGGPGEEMRMGLEKALRAYRQSFARPYQAAAGPSYAESVLSVNHVLLTRPL